MRLNVGTVKKNAWFKLSTWLLNEEDSKNLANANKRPIRGTIKSTTLIFSFVCCFKTLGELSRQLAIRVTTKKSDWAVFAYWVIFLGGEFFNLITDEAKFFGLHFFNCKPKVLILIRV
jgi:hypothetical protein